MDDNKDIDLHIKIAKLESKVEVIEKTNEKIDKLVESNYALSSSIEALSNQVRTYEDKSKTLYKMVDSNKEDIENKIESCVDRLNNVEERIDHMLQSGRNYINEFQEVKKTQTEMNTKTTRMFKNFFDKLTEKTQGAIITAIVGFGMLVLYQFLLYLAELLINQ